jgi:hypothetical protein
MNDSDVLQRAAAALRNAHDGQREGSGFTRARILTSVAQRRRPRRARWLFAAPLATLLLVGSAWAQSTGNWSRVWRAVATVLPFVKPAPQPAPPRGNAAPRPQPARAPEPRPSEPALPAPPADPAAAEPPAAEPLPPVASPLRATAKAPAVASRELRKAAHATSPPTTGHPQPPADPELSAFRSAHELHVQGSPRAAIEAYTDYLRAYPKGRFVPEARYNTALDRIKLGETAAARAALAPFADGSYGGYRQREAKELLDALPR